MPNPYVNKVVESNGTTLIDISDTTAVAADVAKGKYFYLATGEKVEGMASGGGSTRTTIVPEQTVTVSGSYASLTYNYELVVGEEYIYTINGVEYTGVAVDLYGTPFIGGYATGYIQYDRGMYFVREDTALPTGTYTVKVEQESSGGGGSATLITKEITANGTYNASDDSADGYSSVTVNVSSGGSSMNVQIAQGVDRVATTSYTAVNGQSITVAVTGTYEVYWTGFRSSTGGTNGSQLYIGSNAYGTAQTTFTNHGQSVKLTGVQLTAGQVVSVRARARGTNYYMYVGNLTIVQTA